MKENSIKEDILNIEKYIELVSKKNYCECNELNEICSGSQCYGSRNVAYSMKRILSDYKKVIKENEEKNKKERKNKMNADEMFKELGYKKITTDLEIKYRNYIGEIRFWKPTKAVMKHDEDGRYLSIKLQELQAINKKVEELGWK